MKFTRLTFTSILLLLICNSALAQRTPQASFLLEKSKEYYQTIGDFEVTAKYELYRGTKGAHLLDSRDMITRKKDEFFYTKGANMEYLTTPTGALKINHSQKAIEYASNTGQNNWQNAFINVAEYLNYFATNKVEELENDFKVTLQTPLLTQLPYTTIVLYLNKQTFAISKQELLLADRLRYKDNNGQEQEAIKRLVIKITALNSDHFTISDNALKLSSYLNDLNDKVTLGKSYTAYTLVNRTIK